MLRDDTDGRTLVAPPSRVPQADGLDEFWKWYGSRLQLGSYVVQQTPFADLDGWEFDPDTGDIRHHTGRFFAVEGLSVSTDYGPTPAWSQPIVNQPEIGILGILVKKFDGVPHCLLYAKMEPGNINTLQLSPTVQATRSNYTRVHGGARSRYLDFFTGQRPGRAVVDVLQSEHGQWFYQKRNRNMIVETTAEVEEHEDYRWLTFDQIHALLRLDNLVNMSTRSVLSCLPAPRQGTALHTDAEVRAWMNDRRSRYRLTTHPTALAKVDGWRVTADEVARMDGTGFRVIGLRVRATGREVQQWSQPVVAPCRQGLAAAITKRINGVDHVLMHARVDAGHRNVVELGPTVSYASSGPTPPFLSEVLTSPAHRVLFDTLLSEEGGRLYHAVNRYLIVEAADDFAPALPEDYQWLSLAQISRLLEHGDNVNMSARSLVTCLRSCR